MLVITRYTVGEDEAEGFTAEARAALELLAGRPGYRSGSVGRAADDPRLWVLATEWDGAGYYRRALSDFEVRMAVVPLMSRAYDEPSAFEVVAASPARE